LALVFKSTTIYLTYNESLRYRLHVIEYNYTTDFQENIVSIESNQLNCLDFQKLKHRTLDLLITTSAFNHRNKAETSKRPTVQRLLITTQKLFTLPCFEYSIDSRIVELLVLKNLKPSYVWYLLRVRR